MGPIPVLCETLSMIEETLYAYPAVALAAAVGKPDAYSCPGPPGTLAWVASHA